MSHVSVPSFLVSLNNNNKNDSLILRLRGVVGTGRRCYRDALSSSFTSSRATTTFVVVRGLSAGGRRRNHHALERKTRNGAKRKEKNDEREKDREENVFVMVKPAKPESFATRKSRFEAYLSSSGGEETKTTTKEKKKRRCEVCKGKAKVACEGCNGYGWLNESERIKKSKRGDLKSWHPSWCGHCRGSGAMGCARCFGSGEFRQQIGFRLFGDEDEDDEEEEVDDSFDEDE